MPALAKIRTNLHIFQDKGYGRMSLPFIIALIFTLLCFHLFCFGCDDDVCPLPSKTQTNQIKADKQ